MKGERRRLSPEHSAERWKTRTLMERPSLRARHPRVLSFTGVMLSLPVLAAPTYPWRAQPVDAASTLSARLPPPKDFHRAPADAGSFAEWLRGLPLKPDGAPVLLYTGEPKARQDVHVAVVDVDVGNRDLQQCADAVMRLRAEWQFSSGRARDVAFNDTAGKRLRFAASPTQDSAAFRKFMANVFAFAGTASLERELKPVEPSTVAAGDVFIKGGFPGHAVLVADVVMNAEGHRRFLLLQSYMPAQEVHVLKNPKSEEGSPWYGTDFGPQLVTPEWSFARTALRRWP